MPLILFLIAIMTGCGYGNRLTDVHQRAPEVAVVPGAYLSLSRCMFEELNKQAAPEAIVYQWREEPNAARLVAYTPGMDYYVLVVMPTISADFELRFTPADSTTTRLEFRSAVQEQELYGDLIQPALDTCNKGSVPHKGAAAITGSVTLPPALKTAS
jgi:hypothetical protein